MESKYALKKFSCKSSQINAQTHLMFPEIDLPLTVHDTFSPRVETGLLTNFHFAVIHCGRGGKPLRWNIQSFGSSLSSMWNLRHVAFSLCVCLPNCRTWGARGWGGREGGRREEPVTILFTCIVHFLHASPYAVQSRYLILLNPHRINAGRYRCSLFEMKNLGSRKMRFVFMSSCN